jgi:hypothetical protein
MDVIISNTHEDSFKLLVKGRVDIVISGEITGDGIVKDLNMDEDFFYYYTIESMPVYHLVHESRKELLPELNRILKEMKEEN